MYTQNEIILINLFALFGSIFLFYNMFHAYKELGCNQNRLKWQKYTAIILSFIIVVTFSASGNSLISMITFAIFMMLLGYLFYNNQKYYQIYYSILCIGVFITDCIVVMGCQMLFLHHIIYFSRNAYYIIFNDIVIRFMEFITIQLITFVLKRKSKGSISGIQLVTSTIFPIFSLVFLYTLIYLIQIYAGPTQIVLLLINTVLLFVLNIYFTNIFGAILKNNQLKQEIELEKQQSALSYRYYERVEQQYQESRKVIHDIRNHIQTIERLLELQETSALYEYTSNIQEMLNKLGMSYFTSVKVLNIILNDKKLKMEKLGIKLDITIRNITLDFMRDIDITTVFSNLLDNAIEAANQSKEKWILFHAENKHDFISITIQNSFLTCPKKDKHMFRSSKPNHSGCGLKNIERVLSNYNSDIQYRVVENENERFFLVSLMLIPD